VTHYPLAIPAGAAVRAEQAAREVEQLRERLRALGHDPG
jgi:hypothetical protein